MERKTTKEILAESFIEVATQKSANKITVSDIVRNCGMSPATFYRHFQDKYDLITWVYEQRCNEIYKRYGGSLFRTEKITAAWVDYCEASRDLLVNLIKNTRDYDSFINYMVDKHVRFIENDIIACSGKDALTEIVHVKVYLNSSGVIRLMCAWLKGNVTATKDELVEAIMESFPASLLPLITPPKE